MAEGRMKTKNNENTFIYIFIALIVVGAIVLIIKNRKAAPAALAAGHDDGLVRYKNTETRKIEWDYEHMVPTVITITRESKQLP